MKEESKTEGPKKGRKSKNKNRLSWAGTYLSAIGICVLCLGAVFADTDSNEVENTRATLEKWVETCRVISKEKRELMLSKEMLNKQIDIVKREIELLNKKTADAEKSITEADKKRAGMVEENEKLKEASGALFGAAGKLETRTGELLKQVPDSIAERIKPLSQRFPKNPDDSKLSISERFQNVIGILNEINKFNREITVTSEVRKLADGTSGEVTAMYVGIGHAYYVSASGDIAGIGTASPDGWIWSPANESADNIAKAISMLKNEQVAAFVRLPIEIK